ncbi:MAG: META domain-containing protein [Bacteroidales bacterium]|nr:META domain-containing protein [Bacteroidales bacterium]
MKRIVFLTSLLLAMAMVACSTSKPKATAEGQRPVQLADTQVWQLVSIRGRDVKSQQGVVTLVFRPRTGTFEGKASCNRFWGTYALQHPTNGQDGEVCECRFAQVEATQVVCPDAAMYAEQQLLLLLPKATHILLAPYSITLLQSGRELMKFEMQ